MNEADLIQKGYVLINGSWFAPSRVPFAPGHQPDPPAEPVAAGPRKVADPVRRFVRIESYRVRLVDRDAVWVKYVVDALRYAGILFDDSTEWLDLQVEQIKVDSKQNERTEIIIV